MAARELGMIVYRCRRCGELDRSLSSPDITQTVISVIRDTPDPNASGIRASLLSIHTCADGAIGVTDIAGAEIDGWKPPPGSVKLASEPPPFNERVAKALGWDDPGNATDDELVADAADVYANSEWLNEVREELWTNVNRALNKDVPDLVRSLLGKLAGEAQRLEAAERACWARAQKSMRHAWQICEKNEWHETPYEPATKAEP